MSSESGLGKGAVAEFLSTFFNCGERGIVHKKRINTPADQPVCASAPGGVGIVFVRDATDCLYVNCLVRDGPAHRSGVIQHGDILRFVDGVDVSEMLSGAFVGFPLLSGVHGSRVDLAFERRDHQFTVTINRAAHCYPDQIALPPPGYDFPSQGMGSATQQQKIFPGQNRVSTTVFGHSAYGPTGSPKKAKMVGLDEGNREVRRTYDVPSSRLAGHAGQPKATFDVPGGGTGIYTTGSRYSSGQAPLSPTSYVQPNTPAADLRRSGGSVGSQLRMSRGPSEVV